MHSIWRTCLDRLTVCSLTCEDDLAAHSLNLPWPRSEKLEAGTVSGYEPQRDRPTRIQHRR